MKQTRTSRIASALAALVALGACSSTAKHATATSTTSPATPTTAGSSAPGSSTASTAPATLASPGKLGMDQSTADGWSFKIHTVTFKTDGMTITSSGKPATAAAGKQFVAVQLVAGYDGSAENGNMKNVSFHAVADSGAKYDESSATASDAFRSDGADVRDVGISKGATKGGTVVFEVAPADAEKLTLDVQIGDAHRYLAAHG